MWDNYKTPAESKRIKRNRWRSYGYTSLNERFSGSHAHHVTLSQVIHIPADLHRSVKHNLRTGEGMVEINVIAFEYLMKSRGRIETLI